MNASDKPITALVCTANRPQRMAAAAASILANDHPSFELIVVDQSATQDTAAALAPLAREGRFRYVRVPAKGKAAALNQGLRESSTEIVACTDDDCVVPSDWLRGMAGLFVGRPRVAVAFGAVGAPPHDRSRGFVPTFQPAADRLVCSALGERRIRAMGANMSVRRSAIEAIGGFDPAFGPGAIFPSCDDWDIALRALFAGFCVYESPAATVLHHGFRAYDEGQALARRDWYAMGAMVAKATRAGHWPAAALAVDLLVGRAALPFLDDLAHLRRPRGLTRVTAFSSGFVRGLRIPVRSDPLLFDLTATR
jgi:glycosyltransferase involved in cell wall biosynthesis